MKQQQKYKAKLIITGQIHSSFQSTAVNPWHKCWQHHSSTVCGDCAARVCRAHSDALLMPEGTPTPTGVAVPGLPELLLR